MLRFPFITAAAWLLTATVVSAQSAGELLEKGIYAEETQGDLTAAIRIYEQISASAGAARVTVANAVYRLGMCYLKSGRREDATATFRKLSKEYPEQNELLARIPAIAPEVQLLPAPWVSGETLVLQMKVGVSSPGNVMVLRVANTERNGAAVCRLRTYRSFAMFTSVDVDAETFRPLSGWAENTMTGGSARTTYSPGHIDLVQVDKGEERRQQVVTSGLVYDNEEALQLIRRLPLAEGYRLAFPVLAIGSPITPEVQIEVAGRETVTVPAGTFEAFKVRLGVYLEGRKLQDQTLWYSTDSHRYPVKLGDTIMLELAEIKDADTASALHDTAAGVSLTAPDDWVLANPGSRGGELQATILAPELQASGGLTVASIAQADAGKTAQQWAEDHVAYAQKKADLYTVRGAGPERVSVAGVSASRVVADCPHPISGKKMVEYRVFLIHKERRVSLFFDTEQERFAALLPAFDQIVASLRLD